MKLKGNSLLASTMSYQADSFTVLATGQIESAEVRSDSPFIRKAKSYSTPKKHGLGPIRTLDRDHSNYLTTRYLLKTVGTLLRKEVSIRIIVFPFVCECGWKFILVGKVLRFCLLVYVEGPCGVWCCTSTCFCFKISACAESLGGSMPGPEAFMMTSFVGAILLNKDLDSWFWTSAEFLSSCQDI